MIIVSDSSPLLALAICDKLDLPGALFGKVYIPRAVFEEISKPGKTNAEKLEAWGRDKILEVKDKNLAGAINVVLDKGESEAIALYRETGADRLLIDERAGRKYAETYGVNIIGTLGILLQAKQKGLIPSITPYVNKLKKSNIRISDELYNRILTLAGEK
jgi:predicted nucleic acid-binding protein